MGYSDEPLPVGERDRPVTIQKVTDAVAASGMPVEAWTTLVSTEFMGKADMTGRERFRSGQMSAGADTLFEMAYRSDMDPETVDVSKTRRLLYLGRVYDIVSARMIGRREGIELMTLAKVG